MAKEFRVDEAAPLHPFIASQIDPILERRRQSFAARLRDFSLRPAGMDGIAPEGPAPDLIQFAAEEFQACLATVMEAALAHCRSGQARFEEISPVIERRLRAYASDIAGQLNAMAEARGRAGVPGASSAILSPDRIKSFEKSSAELLSGALAAGRQGVLDARLVMGRGRWGRWLALAWPILRVPLLLALALALFLWVRHGF